MINHASKLSIFLGKSVLFAQEGILETLSQFVIAIVECGTVINRLNAFYVASLVIVPSPAPSLACVCVPVSRAIWPCRDCRQAWGSVSWLMHLPFQILLFLLLFLLSCRWLMLPFLFQILLFPCLFLLKLILRQCPWLMLLTASISDLPVPVNVSADVPAPANVIIVDVSVLGNSVPPAIPSADSACSGSKPRFLSPSAVDLVRQSSIVPRDCGDRYGFDRAINAVSHVLQIEVTQGL